MKLPNQIKHLPLRVFTFPAVRALLVCGCLWLLAFSYGRLFLWRDPHSAYFRSEGVYALDYSAVRQHQARTFIDELARGADGNGTFNGDGNEANETLKFGKVGDNPAICASFVTVRRDGEGTRQYLPDALGSMLQGLYQQERAALNVSVLFGDTDPSRHPDWQALWLPRLVDTASGYTGLTDLQMAGLRQAEEVRDLQLKGVFDYLYVLEQCLEHTAAPFIAVFEDDIVFAGDWMARTMLGLQYLVQHLPKDSKEWLYLRLFYTETHLGWDAEEDWWYGHLPLTLVLAGGGTAAILVLLRISGLVRARLDYATIAVLSILVAPGFASLAFMAGKHNLPVPGYRLHSSPLDSSSAGVVPMDKRGCCTQALVFNRHALPGLMSNLRKRERGQTDIMIEEYCDATGLKRFALGKQAVQHVGLVSSRGMPVVNAQSVWAFWFETNRADKVESEHKEVEKGVDWGLYKGLA
ncbi:hypothetical protein QBC46DRAFT_399540 [Diplogelasinospora grovesii]|uniref:Uncharacterized protein n=1 Tax=Diplogelasinospora grovesii TaxID=303347 RepID=A0AAN6MWC3_9PEZI|nr:hypothetical protein QBC46DRAFT_399540 [Diplogelasinospora grovesii]